MHSSAPVPSRQLNQNPWQTRLPFFYGWVIAASVFVALTVSYGVYYSFSVFYVALLEEYGWSRAATAGVFSVHLLMIGFGGVLAGNLIDRFGPAKVVPAGAVLLTIGLVAASRLTELWQFYVSFGLIAGVGLSLCGWVPAVTVVSAWFSTKRGLAIGIASAGIGLGTVGFVPMSQYIISTAGWRSAYLVLASLSLFVLAPQAAILQIGRPEKLGLKPDGASNSPLATSSVAPRLRVVIVDKKWASFPWTISTAVRTGRFWLITSSVTLTTLTNQMLWAHEAAYLVDSGYEKMLAASVVGVAGAISMPAKILWGWASDRFGRERTFTLGIATMLFGITMLVVVGSVHSMLLVGLFACGFAFGYAINAPLNPASAGDIFAGRSFGAVFGVISLGNGFGGAFGAWLAGYVFDLTGSYYAAFGTAAASSATAVLFMWLAAPRKVRRVMVGKDGKDGVGA